MRTPVRRCVDAQIDDEHAQPLNSLTDSFPAAIMDKLNHGAPPSPGRIVGELFTVCSHAETSYGNQAVASAASPWPIFWARTSCLRRESRLTRAGLSAN